MRLQKARERGAVGSCYLPILVRGKWVNVLSILVFIQPFQSLLNGQDLHLLKRRCNCPARYFTKNMLLNCRQTKKLPTEHLATDRLGNLGKEMYVNKLQLKKLPP